MRKLIAVVAGVIVLVVVNFSIYQREQLLTQGRIVLLELAPVDPRSLMQGDYMALRFKLANDAFPRGDWDQLQDGFLVVSLDEKNIATFKRIDDGTAVAANEARLRYRIRNARPLFATDAFYFQEGHAQDYQPARYGEFRVAANGDMILTELRGADLTLLGTAKQ